ncbi:MAG: hypothetical protein ACOZAA_03945 [Pseudomonadota bacterium]
MLRKQEKKPAFEEALYQIDEPLLLMRYANFVPMYNTFFNSFIRIFMLHGIMSSVLLGIVAAINARETQEPVFYIAATLFYGAVSILIVGMMLRLRNLISLYSEEIQAIETRIRVVKRRMRSGFLTSQYITYLIILISLTISAYFIAPARDAYPILRPFAFILKYFDVPIDLSGLEI